MVSVRRVTKIWETEDIVPEVTSPYTSQHNATSERKNMARNMLKSKKVPTYLWSETASPAAHVLNRSPTKRLSDKTPKETWTGIKLDATHFRVFGSICLRHEPGQLRWKLDDKGGRMSLVGYCSTGGYKLYNPRNEQVLINRDFVIVEFTLGLEHGSWEGS